MFLNVVKALLSIMLDYSVHLKQYIQAICTKDLLINCLNCTK